jgi:NitT/TauT family transport system substrate-binding protein
MFRSNRVRQIRTTVVLTILIVGVFLATGCSGSESEELTPVKFRLDWIPGAQHSAFYLAKERGYYSDEGIDLEIIVGSGSSDSVTQLGSNTVEVALVDALVLVQAIEQGVPVQAVAAYYQRSPITLMSPEANPVSDPQQLLGDVTLGSKTGSATYQGLIALLAANGIRQEDINLAEIGFGVQPLLVGQVDAMMGFTMNEPIEAEDNGMPIHELMIADYGVTAYGLTIAASNTFADENSDVLDAFLRASLQGMEEAAAEPQAAVDAVANAVDEIDSDRELKVLGRTVPFWSSDATEAHGFGWQTAEQWQGTIDTAVTLELIQSAMSPEAVYTNEYLE